MIDEVRYLTFKYLRINDSIVINANYSLFILNFRCFKEEQISVCVRYTVGQMLLNVF